MRFLVIAFFIIFNAWDIKAQSDTLQFDSIPDEVTEIMIHPIEPNPEFPGGMDSLGLYFETNNRWEVGSLTIVGVVYIEFFVEVDGSISNIKIVRGLHESCDKEAIRLIKNMPKWKPAQWQGEATRTRVVVPIRFNGLK